MARYLSVDFFVDFFYSGATNWIGTSLWGKHAEYEMLTGAMIARIYTLVSTVMIDYFRRCSCLSNQHIVTVTRCFNSITMIDWRNVNEFKIVRATWCGSFPVTIQLGDTRSDKSVCLYSFCCFNQCSAWIALSGEHRWLIVCNLQIIELENERREWEADWRLTKWIRTWQCLIGDQDTFAVTEKFVCLHPHWEETNGEERERAYEINSRRNESN